MERKTWAGSSGVVKRILERGELLSVSPDVLSRFAIACGWIPEVEYRNNSYVYSGGERRPDIIIPLTDNLGDYATVVSDLLALFAEEVDCSEYEVYLDLKRAMLEMNESYAC